ncbi:MAG: DUF4143 domain-containing protein [Burkholderiaceae bacterium]|nr:DUF4143 domain-containing protein [Burkholderiaceae bacterium]
MLTRDLPQLGVTIPAETLRRFWRMCAHLHGQPFNALATRIGVTGWRIPQWHAIPDLLVDALMRWLELWHANVGKRLVKSPAVYVRDSGLLHALLGIASLDDSCRASSGRPVVEGFIIEQLITPVCRRLPHGFYRTAAGRAGPVVETGGKRRCDDCCPMRCVRRAALDSLRGSFGPGSRRGQPGARGLSAGGHATADSAAAMFATPTDTSRTYKRCCLNWFSC